MKRLFSVLFCAVLIGALLIPASAARIDGSGTGDTLISDGVWKYERIGSYGYTIRGYLGDDASVQVPYSFAKEYVYEIAPYALNENTGITAVKTTHLIRSIGDYAFNRCTSLTEITLFSALCKLGVGSFYGDSAMKSIPLENTSVTEVPAYCFAESGLTSICLPETCTVIGNCAFYRCCDLTKISIPDAVTDIADTAFDGCDHPVICAKGDSYAIEYATAHGIDYVITDAPVEIVFMLGDADGNNNITILDATKIQRVLAGQTADEDGMITLRGDSNGDGLDILDATRIQRHLADFETDAKIGEYVTRTMTAD